MKLKEVIWEAIDKNHKKIIISEDYKIEIIYYNTSNEYYKFFRLLLIKNNDHIIFSLEYARKHERIFYQNIDNFIKSFVKIIELNLNLNYEKEN